MNAQIAHPSKPSFGKKFGWAFLLLMAVFPVLISLGYLTLKPEDIHFAEQKVVYLAHHAMLLLHIVPSMLAILIGPFQFLPQLRKSRLLKFHRWLGRVYLMSVLLGGIGGLYMAQFGYGGLITELGFATLAILWLYSGYRAYKHIRNKEIEAHRQWMIRNYALTFAGTMLRVWMPISIVGLGLEFVTAYRAVAWLCWIPNLLLAEWIIRRRIAIQSHVQIAAPMPQSVRGQEVMQSDL
ncbi:MAG: DUF2306 domain-containing protein [Caldilineaceae bacterium]